MEGIRVLIVPLCYILPWENKHSCNIIPHRYFFMAIFHYFLYFPYDFEADTLFRTKLFIMFCIFSKVGYSDAMIKPNIEKLNSKIIITGRSVILMKYMHSLLREMYNPPFCGFLTDEGLQFISICADLKTTKGKAESRSTSQV